MEFPMKVLVISIVAIFAVLAVAIAIIVFSPKALDVQGSDIITLAAAALGVIATIATAFISLRNSETARSQAETARTNAINDLRDSESKKEQLVAELNRHDAAAVTRIFQPPPPPPPPPPPTSASAQDAS